MRNKGIVWSNTDDFRSAVKKFIADGVYCDAVKGTADYKAFWDEELRRTREGYLCKGRKITGNHYFYLNYCRITRIVGGNGKARTKQLFFPDFWDMDYEYFWWIEIARFGVLGEQSQCREMLTKAEMKAVDAGKLSDDELLGLKEDVLYNRLGLRLRAHPDWLDGGHHMIVAKARRKGFSYKNTAMMVNAYNSIKNSQCVFGVAQTDFADQGMGFVNEYLGFLNEHTAWGKRREYQDTKDHKRASFKKIIDGKAVESGYMSEIILSSFMNNTEATRGKSPYLMLYEEAGTFPALLDVWAAATPSMEDGDFITGQSVVFGTGGKMSSKKGEFAKMFYNPMFYNIMPFENIWDDGMQGQYCGFFFPAHWNYVGMMDKYGNSDFDGAMQKILDTRKDKIEHAVNAEEYQKYVIEFPICPQESFMSENSKVFNIPKLYEQLKKVVAEGLQKKKGICVDLKYANDGKEVKAIPILSGKANPITEYDFSNRTDLKGCPIIYEYPIPDAPHGLYKIGYDPYRQDASDAREKSLAAIIVHKGNMEGDVTKNIIVAEYVGRPETCDDCDEIALKLAMLYNAEVMHENDVNHTQTYFNRKHKLEYLALQPKNTIESAVRNSKIKRKYGCSLSSKNMKDAGEKYLKSWLMEIIGYDENGDEITVVDRIYSVGILQELVRYYREGNFDRVCALFQIMFFLKDEEIGKEFHREEKTLRTMSEELRNMKLFKRQSVFN